MFSVLDNTENFILMQSFHLKDKADTESVTKVFEETVKAQTFDKLTDIYCEHSVVMPPNSKALVGLEDIKKFFEDVINFSKFVMRNTEIDGGSKWVYVVGTYELEWEFDSLITGRGKYIEIRRKNTTGRWLIHRHIFNSDNPLPKQ